MVKGFCIALSLVVASAGPAVAASLGKMPSYWDKDRDGYVTGFDYVRMDRAEKVTAIDHHFKLVLRSAGRLDEISDFDSYQIAMKLEPFVTKFYAKTSERDLNLIGAVREAINNR